MNALVTAGTTLLGSSLVRALRWEGHHVTALTPNVAEAHRLFRDRGVRAIAGDITNVERWANELDNIDVVFHASPTTPGVARFKGASAVASFETAGLIGPGPLGDSSPLSRWVETLLETGAPPSMEGGAHVVDSREIALAMLRAAEIGAEGEFTVLGPYYSYSEMAETFRSLSNTPAKGGIAPQSEGTARRSGQPESERAIQELNLSFRPLEETLADMIYWHSSQVRCLVA